MLCICRLLRFRRREAVKQKQGMLNRRDFASLTADQAQDILKELVEAEFSKLMGFSIAFALFKTYGMLSVSSLLITTGELGGPETASKRTADTGVLLLEFCLDKPSPERSTEAIARMNYLHSRYVKAGKISGDDMLSTLSSFALGSLCCVNKYNCVIYPISSIARAGHSGRLWMTRWRFLSYHSSLVQPAAPMAGARIQTEPVICASSFHLSCPKEHNGSPALRRSEFR